MSKTSTFALMVALGAASTVAQATPSGPLYIDDSSGQIGTVNLSNGNVVVLGNSGLGLTDIGFTASGALYGTTSTGLYSLNSSNGAGTLVASYGATGGGGMDALVGAGSGLYAASANTTSLYMIDTSSYSITTLTGSTGGGSAGDLAPAANGGVFYETLSSGQLVRLSVSGNTFSSTTIGNTGLTNVYGLATGDDGITYAVAGNEVYSVNLNSAVLTPILNYGGKGLGSAYGTAFISEAAVTPTPTPVPEPTSLVVFALSVGLAGLIATLQRRDAGAV